jgi:hypothetical protein
MNYQLFTEKLKKHIEYRLDQSMIKITDLVLEELISFAFADSGQIHLYESGSHKKGSDISTDDEDFSVKSSKNENGKMKISSFRLTRFGDDLSSMVNFIDNDGKNFDNYLVLSRNETTDTISYSFYILPSSIFTASNMEWVAKTGKKGDKKGQITGWQTINNENVSLSISKSMSSQLWIEIKTDFIKDYLSFEVTRELSSLGKNRFVA